MATTVQDIITNGKALCASTLGGTWKELRYTMDVSKNDIRSGYQAYGLHSLAAENVEQTTMGSYMLRHQFELVLCSTFTRGISDSEVQTVINGLYDKADQIYRQFAYSRMSSASNVLLVTDVALQAPESNDNFIVLRMQFAVQYRHTIP